MNYLFRSMHRGDSWDRISPDLTYDDPDKYGDIPYQTLFSIAESRFKFGLLYVGTDDGRVWRSDNGGEDWREINRGIPYQKWVAELVASKYDEATVFMAQNGKRDDDFAPYLWKSTDYGEHWASIVNNLPSGPVNVIKEDPKNPNVLYVGTDLGMYVSLNGGEEWHALPGRDLPSSFYQDLVVHPEEDILVSATHGTANIQYWVGQDPGEATITIRDSDGEVVRELSASGDRGLNAAVWDLTLIDGGGTGMGFRGRANRAAPGTYSVEVSVGDALAQGALVVSR
jgi:photosystem II stability/assembly factor-like uncharacterized protein